jgi:hypothetical protein
VIDVCFWGFPVTQLKTRAYFARLATDLRLTLQRSQEGPWIDRNLPGIETLMGEARDQAGGPVSRSWENHRG